jgi:FtsP/CotA-like multicopper oxidase with cupredoxin domain
MVALARAAQEAESHVGLFGGLLVLALIAQGRPCDPQTPLSPSHDLYCIELIAVPGLTGVSGRVELANAPGPFTVSVAADGRPRITPIASLAGLPPLRAGVYVAWGASPMMDSVINLGVVRNGTTALRPLELEKFVILITAEETAGGREPGRRLLLRGQSPSTRLFPPDLMEFSLGAMRPAQAMEEHDAMVMDWPMPPVPPGITMLPSEMALRPDVSPFLPVDSTVPLARPREIVHLRNGDTLQLMAGLVRRAIAGRTYAMYGYNGQYPGPLLEAPRGAAITVRFRNRLRDSSSIHWHGIRLDNPSDGAAAVDSAFTYHVRFPDAGIYWYHPHVREDVQQELGLYGNVLVRDTSEIYGPANREEVLILDDLLVSDSGRAMIPLGKESPTHALMGRFGNVFLVNGEPGYHLTVQRGEVVRFYLTNASNTRTYNLSFGGARMKLVGADAGPFEHDAWVQSVVIGPAERYVVHVRFERPGEFALVNRVRGLDHLFGRFFPEVDTLGVVTVEPHRIRRDLRASFAVLHRRAPFAAASAFLTRPPDKTLVLTLETHDLPFLTQRLMQLDSIYFAPVEWGGTMPMMNWASTGRQVRWTLRDAATGRENMDIDWHFARGPVKIRLVNERRAFHGMQHPIHLHGQRFLVLAVNGVPAEDHAWKDTVLVPAGSVVDILLDASNPGDWMLHCHIAEHLSSGMMMHFTVD